MEKLHFRRIGTVLLFTAGVTLMIAFGFLIDAWWAKHQLMRDSTMDIGAYQAAERRVATATLVTSVAMLSSTGLTLIAACLNRRSIVAWAITFTMAVMALTCTGLALV